MTPEVILTLRRKNRADQRINVGVPSFAIGRSAENELAIDDPGLSRRHVLITNYSGSAQVADCGSRNGTLVNGRPISGVVDLRDGDVIEIGDECQLIVSIHQPQAFSQTPAYQSFPPPAQTPAPKPSTQANTAPSTTAQKSLNVPIIAGASILGILLITIFAVIFSQIGKDKVSTKKSTVVETPTPLETPIEKNDDPAVTPTPESNDTEDNLERSAKLLIRAISNEGNYQFPPNALEEIRQQVERYRAQPSLVAALRAIDAKNNELSSMARREGVQPAMLICLALAQSDGGQHGDPVAAAQQIFPDLLSLRATFGSEGADSSLIVAAASQIPGGTKKSHPLLATLRRVVNTSKTERNVWFLHEKNALDSSAYNFVIRFLALGIIAQNPQQFGVNASPIAF